MSRDSIHHRIDELLGLLSIHNSRLSLHTEKLSQLDIDVLRKQCIDLYDQVNMLALQGKIKIQAPEPQAKVAAQAPEVVAAPLLEAKPEPAVVVEAKTASIPEPKVEPVVEAIREVPKPKKQPTHTEKKIPQSSAEDEMLSLFEKFSSKPIDSVPKAISLAKRFEFQSVFFDGEPKEYNSFMAQIDGASDREAAFEIYHEYKTRLNWDNEELKDELKALMYRKHA